MPAPRVTIRYGSAYPDAVLDHLEGEVAAAGLAAQLEPLVPDPTGDDTSACLVVEVPDGGLLDGDPDGGGFGAAWDAVVATALRRSRRQQAEGDRRDVVVALRLPGDVDRPPQD